MSAERGGLHDYALAPVCCAVAQAEREDGAWLV
jgi:hypothetical protein